MSKERIYCLLAIIPALVAVAFVMLYCSPAPLTDDWFLVRNSMIASSAPSYFAALSKMRWRLADHPIILPNLIYVTLAPLWKYDSRYLCLITIAAYSSACLACYWRGLRGLGLFILSLIVFSPASYMTFLWGVEFALVISVVLPIIGLAVLDGAVDLYSMALGFFFIWLGIISSAGATFALLGAVVLFALRRRPWEAFVSLGLFVIAFACLMSRHNHLALLPKRNDLYVLTSFGARLFGSPIGLTSFGLDASSVMGAVLMIIAIACIVTNIRSRHARQMAFPCAMMIFGIAAMGAVSLSRDYLGNWHLIYTEPFFCGLIFLAWLGVTPSLYRWILTLVLLSVVWGYYVAFFQFGPAFRAYADKTVRYMRTLESNPNQPKPFAATAGWDVTPKMVRFLRENKNPAFLSSQP